MNSTLRHSLSFALASVCLFGLSTLQASTPKEEGGKAKIQKIHQKRYFTIADEAERTLKDVEEQGYEVTDHTGTLVAASNVPTTSRDLHVEHLNAVKDDLNRMGKEMGRLEALRVDESGWERRSVDKAMPLLKQVAATTDEAIRYVNDNPQRIHMTDYQRIVQKLYDQSTSLWKELHDSVRLADLHAKEMRLRKELRKSAS